MKVQILWRVLLVIVALSTSATALNAQTSVFVMGTGSSLFDARTYTALGDQFGSAYKIGGGVTLGADLPLGKILGVEAAYGLARNNLDVTNTSLSPAFVSTYGVRNQRFSGDVMAHSPIHIFRFRPYLVAGVEFDRYSPLVASPTHAYFNGYSGVALTPNDKVGFNFGGGLDLKVIYRIDFRIDVRNHLTGSPTFGLPGSSSTGAIFPISGLAQNLEYSAGLVFHIGK